MIDNIIVVWVVINIVSMFAISIEMRSFLDSFDDGIKIKHVLLILIIPALSVIGIISLIVLLVWWLSLDDFVQKVWNYKLFSRNK